MIIIGRKDKIDIPEFSLFDIDAKIDTGAYGCAIHCHKVEVKTNNGKECLSFQLLDPSHPEYENKTYTTNHFNYKVVKSSSGVKEHRYTIKTDIIVFGKTRRMEFSLTDRKEMRYPILLGRKFLAKRFLVDVAHKYLSYNLKIENT